MYVYIRVHIMYMYVCVCVCVLGWRPSREPLGGQQGMYVYIRVHIMCVYIHVQTGSAWLHNNQEQVWNTYGDVPLSESLLHACTHTYTPTYIHKYRRVVSGSTTTKNKCGALTATSLSANCSPKLRTQTGLLYAI